MKKLLLSSLLFVGLPLAASAQTTVSSYTAGPTVTVTTATSHGFAVNQGVCLSNLSTCGVVATVPSGTTFTFTQSGVAACASSCGTVSVAPQAIVLSSSAPDQTHVTINYLCWLTTTAPIPLSGATSAWTAITGISNGASSAQKNALGSGVFIEVGRSQTYATSLSGAQLETNVQADCSALQASLAANIQPSTYYGWTFTGGVWVRQ